MEMEDVEEKNAPQLASEVKSEKQRREERLQMLKREAEEAQRASAKASQKRKRKSRARVRARAPTRREQGSSDQCLDLDQR